MQIRIATYRDAPSIKILLGNLGYNTTTILLISQIEKMFSGNNNQVFICEVNKVMVGFIAVHYLPQLGFDGELVIISYLSVDESIGGQDIGRVLEEYVVAESIKRKCDRIQVHCAEWRTSAHRFYLQQDYNEYPKYFTKRLVYGE